MYQQEGISETRLPEQATQLEQGRTDKLVLYLSRSEVFAVAEAH